MEWYEIVGIGGATTIAVEVIRAALNWRKSRAEARGESAKAKRSEADTERARIETTAALYQKVLDEIKENLIDPLEARLHAEIKERRALEIEIKNVRDECEEDKTAIMETLEAERKQRVAREDELKRHADLERAETREIIHALKIERGELYRGVKVLTGQLCNAGITPNWSPPDPEYYESSTPPIPVKTKQENML